jgi:hypothetical protein
MKENIEQQKTQQSYISTFYYLVQNLLLEYAEYEEMIEQVQCFNKENPEETIEQETKDQIIQINKSIRKSITIANTHLKTIEYNTKKEEVKEIFQLKEKLFESYVLDRVKVEEYMVKLNKYTLENILPQVIQRTDASRVYK